MKKKIVFVIHSLQEGGMERVVIELANNLAQKNELDIHIILYGIKRNIFYSITDDVIIHKPEFKFDDNKRIISTIKTIFFLRKKIKSLNPDSIISFGEYWNNMVLLSVYGLKLNIYIADRAEPLLNLGKFQNILRKYLYPTSTGLIVQTEKAKLIYKKQFKRLSVSAIGNPIREIKKSGKLRNENIVLTVGRMINTKNQDRLIKIFSKINKPEWKLIIVGDDSQKQKNMSKLKTLSKELNMDDKVIFVGKQKDVEYYYLKSKIFAFTSSSEGFPNVVGEAMSAGLPVVSYDCMAGPSEMITDKEDGFLIPLFDDLQFQKKLELLMQNEELRIKMGSKAKKNIQRFDSKLIADKFLETILNKE